MIVPPNPLIFHITHVDNLEGILREGGLWCDSQRIARGLVSTNIGLTHIKKRRLSRVVATKAGGMLGDYVPFNFCKRSVMLYRIHLGHNDYAGGQENIVHLVSTVNDAVALGRPWAFSDRHAELRHALHFDDLAKLSEVPWQVMEAQYWENVKEERQAEFLVHNFFPWEAVTEVAVMTPVVERRVQAILSGKLPTPVVAVRRKWYY